MPKKVALPLSDRRRKRHLARRDEMVDAAMKIVMSEGVGALTIKKLAQNLDAAVGAIYRYFPGKTELLIAMQRRAIDVYHVQLREELEGVAGELEQLVCIARNYLAHRKKAPAYHQLVDTVVSTPELLLDPEGSEEVLQSLQPLLQTVAMLFTRASKAGLLHEGDALQRTYVLWAAVHGLDHFQKRDAILAPDLRSDALLSETIRTLLTGWGASAARVKRVL